MEIEIDRYTKRTIQKLNQPSVLNGVTTYYAEIMQVYVIMKDTETLVETTSLLRTDKVKELAGITKQELITQYNNEIVTLETRCNSQTSDLNDMIDQLEAE